MTPQSVLDAPDTVVQEAYAILANDGMTVVEWDPSGDDFTRRDCWRVWEPGKTPVEFWS